MLRRRTALLALGAPPLLAGCGLLASGRDGGPGVRSGATIPREQQWARTAWRYVENNTDHDTGLVGGTDRSPVFTAWDVGDLLASLVAAHELRVIGAREFDLRVSRLLGFLGTMELSGGMLPNKAYSAATGRMVNFEHRPDDIGWSALDLGRLLLWLKILGQRHPVHAEYVDKIVLRFSFCEVIDDCGVLSGATRSQGQLQRYQEGRLGYEQLAAAGFAAWGFDAARTLALPATEIANVLGLRIRHDARDPRTTGAQAPVLTMPYALAGMELGWEPTALREPAEAVFGVQEERWRREGKLTARTDYRIAQPPWVVLDSVHAAGYAWNTIGADGKEYEKLALVATRAAFGMWALRPGEYTQRLVDSLQYLYDPDRGWYEGRFEASGGPQTMISLGTNAAVLEALLFRATGAFYRAVARPGLFERESSEPFRRLNRCMPAERQACAAPR